MTEHPHPDEGRDDGIDRLLRDRAPIASALLASSRHGVIVFDRDLVVRRLNAVMVDAVQQPEGRIVGRPLIEVIPRTPDEVLDLLRSVLDGGPVVQGHVLRTRTHWSAGRTLHFDLSCYPLAAGGEIPGIVVTLRDVTEPVELAAELRDREARLRAAFEQSPIGMTVRDRRAASPASTTPTPSWWACRPKTWWA